ncbi:unnamed protein product [Plutella xylostella]|uniref:Na(+)/K(+)-exchanging ATPase n=1 Tax=Plutella xylostella TaxID=51655 RepID=A0A8S4CUE9_PLUXY|nr:unnamed protein product [Plutella xylostella]
MNTKTNSLTELFRPNNPKRLRSRELSNTRLNLLKKEIQTTDHLIPLNELYQHLGTDPSTGLSSARAAQLLHFYGPNTLTPSTNYGILTQLFKSLCTGFSILIWVGAALCLIAYLIEVMNKPNPSRDNLYLGCVLVAVDLVCGLFSFVQNYRSTRIMKTFNNMLPSYAHCVRDGVLRERATHEVVKGDVVRVQAGDIVPADIRIIDSKGFKVDNSSLTGESIAVPRSNSEGNPNILESTNVAFFSTQCVEGWALGVVICTGDLTALGRVAGLAARIKPQPSPLTLHIHHFMKCVSVWALSLGVFVAVASYCLGYPLMQITVIVIGIIVANIPEGLQPTVTAALTVTAKHMMKRNCVVKNLDAIEALGACTAICSDKTGTLTENKMCVWDVWVWNTLCGVETSLGRISQVFLHSTASVGPEGAIHGDASETAILEFLFHTDDPTARRVAFPNIAEIPFNSVNKYQVSVHLDTKSSSYIVMMKGAPENIISRCSTIAMKNGESNFTDAMKKVAEEATESLANTGERVLAFADMALNTKDFPMGFEFDTEKENFPLNNLRFLGLVGLMDPPRRENIDPGRWGSGQHMLTRVCNSGLTSEMQQPTLEPRGPAQSALYDDTACNTWRGI